MCVQWPKQRSGSWDRAPATCTLPCRIATRLRGRGDPPPSLRELVSLSSLLGTRYRRGTLGEPGFGVMELWSYMPDNTCAVFVAVWVASHLSLRPFILNTSLSYSDGSGEQVVTLRSAYVKSLAQSLYPVSSRCLERLCRQWVRAGPLQPPLPLQGLVSGFHLWGHISSSPNEESNVPTS